MDPPPPPSREEAPAEKRPLDAAEDSVEVAAKKQRLADPSSPIDPMGVGRAAGVLADQSREGRLVAQRLVVGALVALLALDRKS